MDRDLRLQQFKNPTTIRIIHHTAQSGLIICIENFCLCLTSYSNISLPLGHDMLERGCQPFSPDHKYLIQIFIKKNYYHDLVTVNNNYPTFSEYQIREV